MRILVIDTNALISFVTDRNPAQQEKIAAIFEEAAQLKTRILCPQNVVTEFVYVLEKIYKQPTSRIHSMISDFIVMPGVKLIHELDMEALLKVWPEKIRDFGDAIVAIVGKTQKGARIATFDEKFVRNLQSLGLESVQL